MVVHTYRAWPSTSPPPTCAPSPGYARTPCSCPATQACTRWRWTPEIGLRKWSRHSVSDGVSDSMNYGCSCRCPLNNLFLNTSINNTRFTYSRIHAFTRTSKLCPESVNSTANVTLFFTCSGPMCCLIGYLEVLECIMGRFTGVNRLFMSVNM